jgi:DNA-binding transcriptional MerR regulator
MREALPQRNFFRASEVTDLLKIKPHEMRYWESEFPQIRPQKTKTGQRIYRRQDLVLFSAIKHLLLEKKLSLAAAQRIIAESDDLFSTPKPKVDEALDLVISLDDEASDAHQETADGVADDQLLQEAALMLPLEHEDFDDVTQQIYQNFGEELMVAGQPEVLHEEIVSPRQMPVDGPAYEKTLATLRESKASLNEILGMLDKFHESEFWHGFKG